MKKKVAVIGLSFRFPSTDKNRYWEDLLQGKDLVSTVAEDRWSQAAFLHPDKKHPGSAYTFAAGSVGNIKGFDATFFGISPREAAQMDPQQRLLLELSYEAIEHAGVDIKQLKGSNTGVYIGIASSDYSYRMADDLALIDSAVATGNTLSVAANRLSYFFDFQGPSMAIDTACSSSMVAFHQAVRAIQTGESALALTGGISLHLHPYSFIIFSKASMLSPLGRCKVFDASGDGYVRSEGGGVFLLKDYDQAVADGDRILAVVANTAVNTDGKKSGLTVPKASAQADLLYKVYKEAGIDVNDISYVEAHGTGTAVGDPIETRALATALGQHRAKDRPLLIGSVKSNMGHLEAASGVAGLVKAIYSLQHRTVPATIGINQLNPHIDFEGGNLQVVQQNYPLPANSLLTIGVNSFGFGGSNAHVILQSAPALDSLSSTQHSEVLPIIVNGHTPQALQANALQLANYLSELPEEEFYHVSYHSVHRREAMSHRLLLTASSPASAESQLRSFVATGKADQLSVGKFIQNIAGPVWVFSGNGCQWHGMGQALLNDEHFAKAVAEIDQIFVPLAAFSLADELAGKLAEDRLQQTEIAQPALFALQVGICAMLKAQGIKPKAVTGHSVGEVAAAWAAGILSLADAVNVIYHRSRLQGLTRGKGQMTAVGLSVADSLQLIAELGLTEDITIAGENSSKAVTLAGATNALSIIEAELEKRSIFARRLDLDYAFHSAAMDEIEAPIQDALATIKPQPASIPFYSTVTGKIAHGLELDAHYWWLNIREQVQFKAAMTELVSAGFNLYIEIGSHAILRSYIQDACKPLGDGRLCMGTGKRFEQQIDLIYNVVRQCIVSGLATDWSQIHPVSGKHPDLPSYAWQREDYWLTPSVESLGLLYRDIVHPLLGYRTKHYEPHWQQQLDSAALPWLASHQVGESMVFPGTGYYELAVAAAEQWVQDDIIDIEGLEILAPLVFSMQQTKVIQSEIDSRDGSFSIHARDLLSTDEPVLQFKARIKHKADAVPLVQPAPVLPDREVDFEREQHDLLTQKLGLHYGDEFRLIKSGWRQGNVVLAKYDWPEAIASSATEYLLHPGALDCAFQLIIQAILPGLVNEHDADLSSTFIPTSIEHLRFFRGKGLPDVAEMTLLRRSPHSILASFRLFDASGELIAELSQARFKRARLKKSTADIQQLQYQWILAPLQKSYSTAQNLQSIANLFSSLTPAPEWQQHQTELNQELDPLLLELVRRYLQEALLQVSNTEDLQAWLLDLELYQPKLLNFVQYLRDLTGLTDNDLTLLPEDGLTASQLWRAIVADYPQHILQINIVGRLGLHLPALLQQQALPKDLNSLSERLPQLYYQRLGSAGLNYLQQQITRLALHQTNMLPDGETLHILEISQYSPALITYLSQQLGNEKYVFSYACPALSFEVQELALQYPAVNFGEFSAHNPFADSIVLHLDMLNLEEAEAALTFALAQLAPGGLLLVLSQKNQLCAQLVVPFANIQQPIPGFNYWQQWLQQQNFELEHLPLSSNLAGLLVKKPNLAASTPPTAEIAEVNHSPVILVTATQSQTAVTLQQEIELLRTCRAIPLLDETQFQTTLAEALVATPKALLVYFIPAGGDTNVAVDAVEPSVKTLAPLMVLYKVLSQLSEPPALCLLTQDVFANTSTTALIASTAWGFARTMSNELQSALIRIDAHSLLDTETTAKLLVAELNALGTNVITNQPEDEISYDQHGIRRVARLAALNSSLIPAKDKQNYQLNFDLPGQLRNLHWQAMPDLTPADDEILVEVQATGLNFRDVMYALGLLSDEAVENGFAGPTLGLEFAGVIKALGAGVTDFTIGQRVLGFGPASFSRQVLTKANAIALIPEHIGAEAAATIPSTFFTAYYALVHLAQLQSNETVLIHGAAGGVGIAAIQLAQHLGATVIATASSAEKHDFLHQLGVKHVFDSRTLHFSEQIMQLTNGAGVDVVLNSLAGEAVNRNFAILKPFGRFLELGKRDFYENNQIGLRPFRNNISYFGIDADQLMQYRPELTKQLFARMMLLFADGVLFPLPYQSFTTNQVISAFRFMQQAKHIGKIIVNYQQTTLISAAPKQPALQLSADASYLVTGGMAGFGLKTAEWLVEKGAKHLVLLSRRGMATPDAVAIIESFNLRGVQVYAPACDVSDQHQLQQVFATINSEMPPLKGIVHAAVVIEDSILHNLTTEQLTRVLSAKVQGATLLDALSRDLVLEFFVLFSSATTLFGNPGQAAYVAANSFLEALARKRLQQNLPATAVLWGAIDDAGFLARHTEIKAALQSRMGGGALFSGQALAQLENLLCNKHSGVAVLDLDWQALKRFLPSAEAARFNSLRKMQHDNTSDQQEQDFRALLQTLPTEEVLPIIVSQLKNIVGGILRTDASKIDEHGSLYDIGMDSLMGVELVVDVESKFGLRIPVMALSESPTIFKLATKLVTLLQQTPGEMAEEPDSKAKIKHLALQHGVIVNQEQLDALPTNVEQPSGRIIY